MLKFAARKVALFVCAAMLVILPKAVAVGEEPVGVFADSIKTKNILLLGRDNTSGLADVIILASVNSAEKTLTAYQIPRDTYVFLGENSYKKINGAPRILGEDKICELLGKAIGLEVDGYISFDTRLIKDAVNLLGGVELSVPSDMDYDDPDQGLSIHLKKGLQTLSGDDAVGFVRYRAGYLRADLGRMDAQKIFLSALAKKVLKEIDGSDILPLARLSLKYVKTNLSVSQLSALAAIKKAETENIRFVTLPGEEVRSEQSGAWFYILSQGGCEKLFAPLTNGSEFDPEHLFSDSKRAEFENVYQKEIEARIYNAAEIDGEGIDIAIK